ncbi:phosphatidylserine decarboxylase [Asimina triloba]
MKVFDRKTKRLVEEVIDGKIVLSMRAIYQSKNLTIQSAHGSAYPIFTSFAFFYPIGNSFKYGAELILWVRKSMRMMDSLYDQINVAEAKYPVEHFKTFNEFFIRELKPGARTIAYKERDDVAVCSADCRLTAFQSVVDGLRFWIKDYHRFHVPVSGTIGQFVDIAGSLFTVNPIAVNSKYCNVFTENKRAVSVISSPDFGKVAFVAIGATMVGSITFTRKEGDSVQKGDEDAIQIDEDLLANSKRSLETLVTVGMRLGIAKQRQAEAGSIDLESLSVS